jgi:hypothetical protein
MVARRAGVGITTFTTWTVMNKCCRPLRNGHTCLGMQGSDWLTLVVFMWTSLSARCSSRTE